MLLLDLFCGAGGCSKGYVDAGFKVVGVDIKCQKNYPYEFIQADALEYAREYSHEYDVIHASPPCQAYSILTPKKYRHNHPDMINETREVLISTGKPFVIENVPGARHKLRNPLTLCGSMFELPIQRHRYFEIFPELNVLTSPCHHISNPVYVCGSKKINGEYVPEPTTNKIKEAMGIDWMVRKELDQAIPPAYTRFIGEHLRKYFNS